MKTRLILILIIISVGALIYANSLTGEFQFDDYPGIAMNPAIQNLHHITEIHLPYNTWTRFLTFLTFALNYHFGGLDVFGYHLVNLIIHLINALFVFWLFYLVVSAPRLKDTQWFKRRSELALFAALIFVSHPVPAQAVSYIYQRLASFSTLWYLLTICLYLKGRLEPQRQSAYFAGAALATLLGVFTKEIVFTIPLMIVMAEALLFAQNYDRQHLLKSIRDNREVWKLIFLLGLIVLLIPAMHHLTPVDVLNVKTASHSHVGETVGFADYIPTQMRVIVTYIRLLFLPIGQRLDYDFSLSYSFLEPKVLLSVLFILIALMTAVRSRKKNPLVSFGIFWFFIALCVETFFPIRNVIWEYRTYLPMTGFCFFLIGILSQFFNRRRLSIIVIVIVCILGVLTVQRNRVYHSGITLWKESVDKHPEKPRPYSMLGSSYINHGQYDQAIPYLKKALEYAPDHAMASFNLARVYMELGHYKKALPYAIRAYKLEPDLPLNLSMVGQVYYRLGDFKQAIHYYQEAIRLQPTVSLVDTYGKLIYEIYQADGNENQWMKNVKFLETIGGFSQYAALLKQFVAQHGLTGYVNVQK